MQDYLHARAYPEIRQQEELPVALYSQLAAQNVFLGLNPACTETDLAPQVKWLDKSKAGGRGVPVERNASVRYPDLRSVLGALPVHLLYARENAL